MHAAIQTLRSLYESFLNLPYHRVVFIAAGAAALLLIGIPLIRLIFSSNGSDGEETIPAEAAYPSMFGLNSAVDFGPAPIEFAPASASNVTPIHAARTVPCIHCGVTMSPRQDFCPACGYAQPTKQSFTA